MPQNTTQQQHQRLSGPFSARKTTSENYTIKCKISSLSCCCFCCCCRSSNWKLLLLLFSGNLYKQLRCRRNRNSTAAPQFSLHSFSFYVHQLSLCLSVCPAPCQSASLYVHTYLPAEVNLPANQPVRPTVVSIESIPVPETEAVKL